MEYSLHTILLMQISKNFVLSSHRGTIAMSWIYIPKSHPSLELASHEELHNTAVKAVQKLKAGTACLSVSTKEMLSSCVTI